jgi:hypothetical protein
MAHSSTVRRKLFMHPAHRTVGVWGDGIGARPYCRVESFRVSIDALAGPAVRVVLVAHQPDADACAALALFQQAAQRRSDVDCRRVEFDAAHAGSDELTDADCVVLFRRGVHVARHWADLDAAALAADGPPANSGDPMRIEIAPAARWHPVLESVEPFLCRPNLAQGLATDATPLLITRAAGGVQAVAWIEHLAEEDVFHTNLGSSEDLGQADFVRLVQNAVVWIGQ